MIYFDERWIGPHGIGRFAGEIARAIPHRRAPVPGKPMDPLDPIRLARALADLESDAIFFSPGYNAPLWTNKRFVLTVHDLNHIDRPENSSAAKRLYYELVLKRACRHAAAVLTVSDFSMQRIQRWSAVSPARIFNVGNGVSARFRPEVEPHCPGYSYILCVSNRRLHKNEGRLIAAFAAAGLAPSTRLVFTGDPSPETVAQAIAHGVAERVVYLGPVAEERLPSIYTGALCLAFPSLYEGFGLPVIEAFACGTPVVTSKTTSLPEVAGDAALLVDPTSVEAIAAALFRVVNEASTRATLRERGFARASACSWDLVIDRVKAALATI